MANATVDHANLANNAFSNFAPLLTLFGEEVTKQFIATSIGIPDSLLLSVAPIGLMTIIVSAIRVGGNRFMKSIIGRARESPNEQEKEILPSTSAKVHEIWDGSRVVRQTGPSITKLFCFDPPQLKLGDRARRSLPKRQLNYLLSPEDALSSYGDQQLYGIAPIFQRYFGQAIGKHSLPCLDGIPPNLTLNSTTLDRRLTVVFTAAGLLVQLSVTEPLSEIELKEIAIAMLEMHASLLDCDADTKQLKSLATRCLKTMKDVLRILQIRKDNGAGEDVDVCDLGDFLYMQIHDALDPSKQMHSSVVQVGFPVRNSRDHFAAHTGFLSAVIGYTRYIYDEKVRQRSGAGGMSTIRILGHCTPHNVEAYVKSLREWTGMRGDELFPKLYLHLETSDDWSTVPIPSSGLGSTVLLFGSPLSHRFRASERTEAYYSSMYELQFINYAPYQHNIEGNIVLEIILAFFLRVIDMYRNEVTEFLRCNPKDRCQALADILIKHNLCNSAEQARLAIVPALLNH